MRLEHANAGAAPLLQRVPLAGEFGKLGPLGDHGERQRRGVACTAGAGVNGRASVVREEPTKALGRANAGAAPSVSLIGWIVLSSAGVAVGLIAVRQPPDAGHHDEEVPPMIAVDHEPFDDVTGERTADDDQRSLQGGGAQRAAQGDHQRDHHRREIGGATEPAGAQEHAEVDVVRFLVMVRSTERVRADAERVFQDQPARLRLAAEPSVGAVVVGLIEASRAPLGRCAPCRSGMRPDGEQDRHSAEAGNPPEAPPVVAAPRTYNGEPHHQQAGDRHRDPGAAQS